MYKNRIDVDKKYVHKYRDENVFLYNLRRVLPKVIDKKTIDHAVPEFITQDELQYLLKYYSPAALPDCGKKKNSTKDEIYAVKYLPKLYCLSRETYDKIRERKHDEWERELLESLYEPVGDNTEVQYVLKSEISEPYDNFILYVLELWDLFLNAEERTKLSNILEKIEGIEKKNIFMANMFVNTCHPFFFEHPNEHVPAIMLIETVRQFLLACSHQYGNVPFHDTQIIVNYMNSKFMNYININYPILFKSTTKELKVNRHGYWQYQQVQVEVFQGNKCMALFTFDGNCIPSALFERIRRNQIRELRQSRYIPFLDNEYKLEIRQPENKNVVRGSIKNISLDGMSIIMDTGYFDEDMSTIEVKLVYGADKKTIEGTYQKIWFAENKDIVVIGLKTLELDEHSIKNIHDLIFRESMVVEKREVY